MEPTGPWKSWHEVDAVFSRPAVDMPLKRAGESSPQLGKALPSRKSSSPLGKSLSRVGTSDSPLGEPVPYWGKPHPHWGKALPHWGEGFPVVPECVPTRGWRTEKSFSRTAMCLTLRALPYWSGTYRRAALPQFCGRDAETDHDSPREYIPF